MTALDIANAFIDRYSQDLHLTNLKLNKLVYYAQVESLRETGRPLFTDQVQAWGYGPVIPSVYRAYKAYGNRRIMQISDDYRIDSYAEKVMSIVAQKYGYLTAFDLVDYSHRKGSAWEKTYDGKRNKTITLETIAGSRDISEYPHPQGTLAQSIDDVEEQFGNALRMLGDA